MRLLVDCHVFDGKFQGTRTYLEGLYRCLTEHKDITFYFAAHDLQNLKRVFMTCSLWTILSTSPWAIG